MSSAPNCDPSGNSSCFFSSIQVNNQTASIELSGTTSGYVALGLTASNQSEVNVIFRINVAHGKNYLQKLVVVVLIGELGVIGVVSGQ